MILHRALMLPSLALFLISAGCSEDYLHTNDGTLLTRVLNAHEQEMRIEVTMNSERNPQTGLVDVERPETRLSLEQIPIGLWQVEVTTLSILGEPLRSVLINDIYIQPSRETEVVVDLAELTNSPSPTPDEPEPEPEPELEDEACSEDDEYLVCQDCIDGFVVTLDDDPACGIISCENYEGWSLEGINSPSSTSECLQEQANDITENRCLAPGVCIEASNENCPTSASTIAQAGLCKFITGCEQGQPSIENYPNGTPCLSNNICNNGNCIPTEPEAGCADGQRDGFLSINNYPLIAACSGGWSIGGVTRDDLTAECGHQSGNQSGNPDGNGCSAADLCAPGWHVCQGHQEVSEKSPAGCDDAVAPGTPNKGVFFAIHQNSTSNTMCDNSTEANDVFGCGNLGNELSSGQNCGPLTRALASTQPNSCGYNEAEPGHGPWQCLGGNQSHFEEGALVTKNGCPNNSCSYDGYSVGNQDRGGVLCCRN